MSSSPGEGPGLPAFEDIHAKGEALNNTIRVEVTGGGELTRLTIEPKAMRLPSVELAEAIRSAVNSALASAREQALAAAAALQAPPDLGRLSQLVDELSLLAQRRMGDFSAAASDISARIDRR